MGRDSCLRAERRKFKSLLCPHLIMTPAPSNTSHHWPSHHQKYRLWQQTWSSPSKIPKFNPQIFTELLLWARNPARGCDRQKEGCHKLYSQGTYSTDGPTSRVSLMMPFEATSRLVAWKGTLWDNFPPQNENTTFFYFSIVSDTMTIEGCPKN